MKIRLLVSGMLVALSLAVVQAQEARVERVKLWNFGGEWVNGIIFHNKAFYVNQDTSPVRITDAKVRHVPEEITSLADWVLDNWGGVIKWDNVYLPNENTSPLEYFGDLRRERVEITIDARGENVVAVKFGVIVYDAFKEYLGGLTAITMDPPTTGMQWEYSPPYLFKFKKYGIVGIYVRQVRLKDGEIWNFDSNFVTKDFSERFGEITKSQITEPGG